MAQHYKTKRVLRTVESTRRVASVIVTWTEGRITRLFQFHDWMALEFGHILIESARQPMLTVRWGGQEQTMPLEDAGKKVLAFIVRYRPDLRAVLDAAGVVCPARELPAAGRAVEEKKPKAAYTPPPSGERKALSVLCREALMVGPKTTSEILASCQAAGSTASKQQVYGVLYNLSQNRRVERVEDDGKEAKWRLGK